MKILHTMPYSPIPPTFGGALRVYHMLKNIVDHHEVSVLTYGDAQDEQDLRKEFPQIHNIFIMPRPWTRDYRRLGQLYSMFTRHSNFYLLMMTKEIQRMITEILERHDYDMVLSEFSTMGQFHLATNAVKILDTHNVEHDLFRRMYEQSRSPFRRLHYRHEYLHFYHEEIDACKRQDAMFVTSPRDKELFEADVPEIPKYVIPNGVDTSYFTPSNNEVEPNSIVFTGMIGYYPNYDGVMYFLDEIFPHIVKKIPGAKISIVGGQPPEKLLQRANSNIVVTGFVDDVRPYVWKSSVYVVPLRMGGGTRLKVLEALAMKKAIVTTSIGSEGIDVKHGKSVLMESNPQAFADAVVTLLQDAEARERLVTNGYELVKSQYEWSVIGKQAEAIYQDVVRRVRSQDSAEVK